MSATAAPPVAAHPRRPWARRSVRALLVVAGLLIALIYGVVPYWMTGQFMNAA